MTGEELYRMWAEELSRQGVETDPWDSLEDRDRAAWNRVAEHLERRAKS